MKNPHNFLIHRINERIARSIRYRGRVIDLGCGASPYKKIILEGADEYIGVDWPHSAYDQRHVDVFADLCEPHPFDAAHADMIVAFQVLEHVRDPAFFVSECQRVLKPGGTLVLTVPFMWHVHEAPHDYQRYTRHGLEELLTRAGFADLEITPNTGFWQTWVLKFNYHTLRFARGPAKAVFYPVWYLGQTVAPWLDAVDPSPEETATYTVVATRPP